MKVIKYTFILFLFGIVLLACFFIVSGKNKSFGRKFIKSDTYDNSFHGDLYDYCEIPKFRESIQETKLVESKKIGELDNIVMGDSFFNTGFDSLPVPNYLQQNKGQNIFYKATSKKDITPLAYLKLNDYQPGHQRYFIWETIERKSMDRGLALKSDFEYKYSDQTFLTVESKWDKIEHLLFDRIDVEYFIRNNVLIKPVRVWLKNKAFEWFGDIDNRTAVYLNNPSVLFFDEEVAFNENISKLSQIEKMADNIAAEARLMKEQYNLILVYIVIPNKFSIYGNLINGSRPYDGFIPKLQTALKRRNVVYLDLYQEFINQKNGQLLYYGGDTHYNKKGKQILIELLNNKLNE